ncbi:MAG: hypothetical protein SFZ24_12290 [Planctomycetota bacterium]|nr:hypothetical protein [Planctomycetota bacterium]
MKNRSTLRALIALAALGSSASAFAGTFVAYGDVHDGGKLLGETGAFRDGTGGEFKVVVQTGWLGVTGLAADAIGAGERSQTFQTFCIETDEFVDLGGTTYHGTINTIANFGGANTDQGDPIDARTAFLYTAFRHGTLQGYNYASGAGREASAVALQQAFWFIEGESGGANNAFVALANAAVAPGGSWHTQWGPNSIGNVRALNNVQRNANGVVIDDTVQDFLTLIPLPGATGMALAGLAVVGTRRTRTL